MPLEKPARAEVPPRPSLHTSPTFTGFPLNLPVVEFDVEIPGRNVRAIDQHQLEVVGLVRAFVKVSNARPGHTERIVTVDGSRAVGDGVSGAGINVAEERRDDDMAG